MLSVRKGTQVLDLSQSLLQMDRSARHLHRAALLLSQSLLDTKG